MLPATRQSSPAPAAPRPALAVVEDDSATVPDTLGERSSGLGDGVPQVVTDYYPPRAVGPYRLLEVVGRGGLGVVYRAVDMRFGQEVAVKLVRGGSTPTKASERLGREATALSRLEHPNVVSVRELGAESGHHYLAMELVRGSTIKDWQRRPLRTADEIIHAYAQAGDALAATHADGLLHRDFKPTNVLVGRGGRAVLIDYGLARRTTEPGDASMRASGPLEVDDELDVDVTQTGMTIGTPAYMSPEQIRCERLDARSDQFSFCVALYEALMGRRPFAGATSRHVMEAIVFGRRARVVPKREVPRRVRQVIERGLSADRDARYPNMNALLADLRAAVAN